MMQYMSATTCPVCHGRRLRPESLAVTIPIPARPPQNRVPTSDSEPRMEARKPGETKAFSIADFTALPLERAHTAARNMNFTGRDRIIADRLQREIIERLEFLNAVGLGYLALDRAPQPSPAAKASASGSPPKSAPNYAASSTSSTNPPSAFTSATTSASSPRSKTSATSATPSSSSSTTKTPSAKPTTSSTSAPEPERTAATSSPTALRSK